MKGCLPSDERTARGTGKGPGLAQAMATTQPSEEPKGLSLYDPTDGALDMSQVLATQGGFLPLVIPVTEPAIGYGIGAAAVIFHEKPQTVAGEDGAPARLLIPTSTAVGGFGTSPSALTILASMSPSAPAGSDPDRASQGGAPAKKRIIRLVL